MVSNLQVAMKLKRKEWRPGQEIVKQGDVGAARGGTCVRKVGNVHEFNCKWTIIRYR